MWWIFSATIEWVLICFSKLCLFVCAYCFFFRLWFVSPWEGRMRKQIRSPRNKIETHYMSTAPVEAAKPEDIIWIIPKKVRLDPFCSKALRFPNWAARSGTWLLLAAVTTFCLGRGINRLKMNGCLICKDSKILANGTRCSSEMSNCMCGVHSKLCKGLPVA